MAERGSKPNQLVSTALNTATFLQPPVRTTPEYKALWNSVVTDFPPDYFRPSDVHALDMFCRLSIQYKKIEKQIEAEGYTVEDRFGGMKAHPLLQTLGMITQRLNALRAAIRIQPSSRYDETFAPKGPMKNVVGVDIDNDDDEEGRGWVPPLAGSK